MAPTTPPEPMEHRLANNLLESRKRKQVLRIQVVQQLRPDAFAPRSLRDPITPSQRSKILELLRQQCLIGATNLELNKICFRYGTRIFEAHRLGYAIRTVREKEGFFRFVRMAEATEPKPPQAFFRKEL